MEDQNLFTVEDIQFASRGKEIVSGITLDIPRGTTTAIVGKSGCGKSTLLKLIAGILVPTGGKVLFEGKNIQTMNEKENREFRRRCAFIFQDSALWANQSILQNLSLPLRIHFPSLSSREREFMIQNICAMVDFDRPLSLRPADLSMGERKKVAFARAMMTGPEVLFLDECTESLDVKGATMFVQLLHNFIEQGNSIVYVTHSTTFAREFPGNLFVVDQGRLRSSVIKGEHLHEI